MTRQNAIFVIAGNARTFVECINSCYNNLILKLFEGLEYNIYIYLYLKLIDSGPKGIDGHNFTYNTTDHDTILQKIQDLKDKYVDICIEYKIIDTNEITDDELLSQVKDRDLYHTYLNTDSKLLRAMHCHYNLECCGKYILEKEKAIQINFNYIIYTRPDIYFTRQCGPINVYKLNSFIMMGCVDPCVSCYPDDLVAVIPRNHLDVFFFGRMNIYRHNTTTRFGMAEEIYWYNIPRNPSRLGKYYIKRQNVNVTKISA